MNENDSGDRKDKSDLKEGRDYYIDSVTGYLVFTAEYLLRRGYCCNNNCRHCPYTKTP